MSYEKKQWKLKDTIVVEERHTARYRPRGTQRKEKKEKTPEKIEKWNQRKKQKKCWMKMRHYMSKEDYFVTLTYRKEERPSDMKECVKDVKMFMQKLRRHFYKCGKTFYWFRNIEVGSKGAWHIHMVINRVKDLDLIIKRAWKKGKVIFQLCYENGGFEKLAAYITKTEKTDKRLRESSYSCSRNMPLPDPEKKVYRKWNTFHKVRVPKGYYLDKNSVIEGFNPVTGYRYREYVFYSLKGGT